MCISIYMTVEMMLNDEQIWANFLSEFKMGHKAVNPTHNINNASGPGTVNELTVQWWFKKFWKKTRALKVSSIAAGHQKLTRTNWEQLSKLILLQHEKLPKNSMLTILWSFSIWSKLEVEKLGASLADRKSKKSSFWSVFSYCTQ